MKIIYYYFKGSDSNRTFTNFSDFFNYFKDMGVIRIKRSEFCLGLISLLFYVIIYKKDPNWRELTKRLPKVGLLTASENDLKELVK